MGLLDSLNDKLGKYLGFNKQDSTVQIFEESASSEPLAVPGLPAQARGDGKGGAKHPKKVAQYGKEVSDEVLEKEIGNDMTMDGERERARKEALAQLEKEANEATGDLDIVKDLSDKIKPS